MFRYFGVSLFRGLVMPEFCREKASNSSSGSTSLFWKGMRPLLTNADFSFDLINVSRVADILANLNTKKSAGPDELSSKLLKVAALVIAGPLTKLFNHCVISSAWPRQWKLCNVKPVYKKVEETSKFNYCPISVLSAIPKVFEKLKFEQLYRNFSPLLFFMSGFLRGHSCCIVPYSN